MRSKQLTRRRLWAISLCMVLVPCLAQDYRQGTQNSIPTPAEIASFVTTNPLDIPVEIASDITVPGIQRLGLGVVFQPDGDLPTGRFWVTLVFR